MVPKSDWTGFSVALDSSAPQQLDCSPSIGRCFLIVQNRRIGLSALPDFLLLPQRGQVHAQQANLSVCLHREQTLEHKYFDFRPDFESFFLPSTLFPHPPSTLDSPHPKSQPIPFVSHTHSLPFHRFSHSIQALVNQHVFANRYSFRSILQGLWRQPSLLRRAIARQHLW